MITVSSLISTSASDCKITLEGTLQSNPELAAQLSLQLLERLQGAEGQTSRRKVAASTLRAAAKRIADDDTFDNQGPSVADLYYSLPIGDLRKVLAQPCDPGQRLGKIITTLMSIRGEVQCETRRKVLLAALGKSIKAFTQEEGRVVA